MPRNSSGNYSLPAGNPVQTGTTITTSWANNTLQDIGAEITDSLSRSGEGPMLAPLKLTDGTVAAPALSFDSDADCGLYRGGANDVRMGVNTTRVQTWDTNGSTFNEALATAKGLTATQSTSNTAAITSTGNGSGDGVAATGGTTSGRGVTGTGGAPNGDGVRGIGTGTGRGLVGIGGSSNGAGVLGSGAGTAAGGVFTGGTTGAGVTGAGGLTSGNGGTFTATAGGSNGVAGTGHAGGSGVVGTGGATNGSGVHGTGSGSGNGVTGIGGSSNAIGVHGTGGGTTGAGGSFGAASDATAGARQTALVVRNGDIDLSDVPYPAPTTAHSDKIGPRNIIKAWARLITAGGTSTNVTVDDGFNITSATVSTTTMTVTFASAFANATFAVFGSTLANGVIALAGPASTTTATVRLYDTTAAGLFNMQAGASQTVNILVVGVQ